MDYDLAKCLNDAADLIERKGWTHHAWANVGPDGMQYCMLGAVWEVCPDIANHRRRIIALAEALGFMDLGRAIAWNDRLGRTKVEVLARLRAGAIKAASGPALLLLAMLSLSGCSLATAVALAPVIGEVAKPVVEGLVEGLRVPLPPPPPPPR